MYLSRSRDVLPVPPVRLEEEVTAARIRELEDRAAALVEYGNSLPDGVTTEAFAEASNLRREARELRQGSGPNLGLDATEAKDSSSAASGLRLPRCVWCGRP